VSKKEAGITIIGAGPGGYVAAIKAAQLGANVILIEKDELGGTCLNKGCIPTKFMVNSSKLSDNLRNASRFGIQAESSSINMENIIRRKNGVVRKLVGGIQYLLKHNGVEVIHGNAKIKAPMKVEVTAFSNGKIEIQSDSIVVATDSKSSNIPITGSDLKGVITSTEALELKTLPKQLVVVGGGIIGLEFAFMFANFGTEITVIEYMDSLLPKTIDTDIAREIERIAKRKGINIFTSSKVKEICEHNSGKYRVEFDNNGKEQEVICEKVLMAVGREPCFDGIGVEELGIELNTNGRGIKVNERMQTSIPNIYAIGDVTDKALLAHVASNQGITAVNNILGRSCRMSYDAVPSAIFTDPEIATVGMDERTARELSYPVNVGKFPFSANGKVLTTGEEEGFIKLIADKSNGVILGGAMIGVHATDLIGEITLAVQNNLTIEDIAKTIHAHPTVAEVIHEAALSAGGKAIHFVQ
jgi:dihydrolipoamide dehydrogenase